MNDLEKELKQLAPHKLSQTTIENIRREVGPSQPAIPAVQHTADGPPLFWGRQITRAAAVLAVAAGLAAFLFLSRKETTAPEESLVAAAVPAALTNEQDGAISVGTILVDQQDEGMIVDPRHGPVRRIRCRFMDNVRWDHPRRGGTVIKQVPREEIVLVSVPVD